MSKQCRNAIVIPPPNSVIRNSIILINNWDNSGFQERLKGEEEETEVLEKSKVSFKYIVCLSLKEVNMFERTQLTVA